VAGITSGTGSRHKHELIIRKGDDGDGNVEIDDGQIEAQGAGA